VSLLSRVKPLVRHVLCQSGRSSCGSLTIGHKTLSLLHKNLLLISLGKAFATKDPRKSLAKRFIRGCGIEIGALHNPLWVPPGSRVTYVDRMDENDLRRHYPELNDLPLVKVNIVDDGEKLTAFEPNSQDFIIANHFLEHTQDPIGTVRRHLEVLRPGGVLYMAVPDRRFTFDKARPESDFAHVLRDHVEGPEWSHDGHIREFASLVMGHSGEQLESAVNGLKATNYSIHFHVWSEASFRDFLHRLIADLRLPMKIAAFVPDTPERAENICVLRKVARA
jgi:SAM-dependent methyltransferase